MNLTSKETDLKKLKGRAQTQTEFDCKPNNFLVLDDQCTVLGAEFELERKEKESESETEIESGTSHGIIVFKYELIVPEEEIYFIPA